jgi:D-3-phosphoglycerate dehydrogenase
MSAKYRVLLTDRAWPDSDLEKEILGRAGADVVEAPNYEESTLIDLARQVDAVATCWAPVRSAVIRSVGNCRVISRFGIGLDNISVETATSLRIPVTNVPDYCVPEVADHAVALLLACARKVAFYDHQAKDGCYNLQAGPTMYRLEGSVLGLVGFGRIGQAVARRAAAFGIEVIAHTRTRKDSGTGCRMVSFGELLERSDFISLHLPLSPSTRHLMGDAEFERMKPTAYLVNTSRGPLINHDALLRALESGQVAGAALDVFDPEPPDLREPLFRDERVIVTPHTAFLSAESLDDLRRRVAHQIADALQGLRPEHVVNPEVYEEPA